MADRSDRHPLSTKDFKELHTELQSANIGPVHNYPSPDPALKIPDGVPDWTYWITVTDQEIGGGGFGNVQHGHWRNLPQGYSAHDLPCLVVKELRWGKRSRERVLKMLRKELGIWKELDHPNILPFGGICCPRQDSIPALISEWMPMGTVRQFIKANPTADRWKLIRGMTRGLNYLHNYTPEIIHGDIKGANVLVDSFGQVRLADFGIGTMIVENETLWMPTENRSTGTIRWLAPELLNGHPNTMESDIYAWARTALEILTDKLPFYNIINEYAVAHQILTNARAPIPEDADITPEHWDILVPCWNPDPALRPGVTGLLICIERLCNPLLPHAEALLKLRNADQRTVLSLLAAQSRRDVNELLIDGGAPSELVDHVGTESYYTVVSHILELDNNPAYTIDSHHRTPLSYAAAKGDTLMMSLLLQAERSVVNVDDSNGRTPLTYAVIGGFIEAVELLLTWGADPNKTDDLRISPLMHACQKGLSPMVAFLLNLGADAIEVNTCDLKGHTALHIASEEGHANIVRGLLGYGASPNATSKTGYTALHFASEGGRTDIVRDLIKHGASPNATSIKGVTALMTACMNSRETVVKELLRCDIDVNLSMKDGHTALMLASWVGNGTIVEDLLNRGAVVDARDSKQRTALMSACHNGHVDIVRRLLWRGADVNITSQKGWTALLDVCLEGHVALVGVLIQHGANVRARSEVGWTPLIIATRYQNVEFVQEIRKYARL